VEDAPNLIEIMHLNVIGKRESEIMVIFQCRGNFSLKGTRKELLRGLLNNEC
jgi:hypothetical protein